MIVGGAAFVLDLTFMEKMRHDRVESAHFVRAAVKM